MDLGRCPKCGVAWKGWDKCKSCGYVPIGVGLDKLPKGAGKKKKRARKYVEPGSSRGFLLTIFLGACGYCAYAYQPWADDWELVRGWFGKGRHHDVVGEWMVVKVVSTGRDKPLISGHDIDKGFFKFGKDGKCSVELVKGDDKTAAAGHYLVQGTLVDMTGLQSDPVAAGPIPHSVKINLHWTGPNAVIASYNGTETIYLRRHDSANPLTAITEMGLKPENAGAPGQMRGVIDNMRRSADDAVEGGS